MFKKTLLATAFALTAITSAVIGSKYGYGYEKSKELGI